MNLQATATEITQTGYSTKNVFKSIYGSSVLQHACHELFFVLGYFYASGMKDAKSLDGTGQNYIQFRIFQPGLILNFLCS